MALNQHLRSLVIVVLIIVCLTACATPTQPETATPDISIQVAWNGYWQSPGWTEVAVTLTTGASAWNGQVRITDRPEAINYYHDVTLGANGRTTIHIPFYLDKTTRPVMELLHDGTVVAIYGVIKFSPTPQNSGVCAVFGVKPATPITQSSHCQVIAYYESWGNVPANPLVWESLERIYITSALQAADAPTPEHLNTLETWVSHGGQLFIFGETALSQISSTQSWLVISSDKAPSIHTTLTTPGTATPFPQGFLSATLNYGPDKLVISTVESELGVLAARQQYGWGSIDVAGWSATITPSEWFTELDHIAFNEPPVPVGQMEGSTLRGYHLEDIFKVDTVADMSPWLFVVLMLVYVGVIGPGILIITKKRKQPLLTWLLIPAWIGVGILAVSLVLRGTLSQVYPITGELAVLEYPLGARTARATQYSAIFAPNSDHVTWETSAYGQTLFGRYQSEYWYEEGDPYPLDVTYNNNTEPLATITASDPLGVMTWSAVNYIPMPDLGIRSFTAEQITPSGQVSPDTVHIKADIQSQLTLQDVHLIYRRNSTYLVYITEEVKAGTPTIIDIKQPIRTNTNFDGYFDYCTVSSYDPYAYSYSSYYPASINPMTMADRFPEAHPVKSYKTPDDGVCYLVATTDELPLVAHDITQAEGKTCLLIAIPCADLAP